MKVNLILEILQKYNGCINSKILNKHEIANQELLNATRQGFIKRLDRGIYSLPNLYVEELYLIHLKYSKAVFSHGTALYLHGLTTRMPMVYEVTMPKGGKIPKKGYSCDIKLYARKPEYYSTGLVKVTTDMGFPVYAYDIERTLCDLIIQGVDSFFLEGLENYLQRKDRDLLKLGNYAKLFEVTKKLHPYLEGYMH